MADIRLNFSSQWPTVQVAKVINSPASTGETSPNTNYSKRHKHGLDYVPFAVGMQVASGSNAYDAMIGLDVDDTYVYIPLDYPGRPVLECAVVYAIDINTAMEYPHYDSAVGDVLEDKTGTQLDLRKFLLHSRAVGPMVLNVSTKDYTSTDLDLSYTTPLDYPTFTFGYVHRVSDNMWVNAPLAGQAWPVTRSDGYTSTISSTKDSNGNLIADKGSLVILRNPAIITNNTVEITL